MSEFVVEANYLPAEVNGRYFSTRYGGGRLIIEDNHLELLYRSLGSKRGPGYGILHKGKSVLWINLRIAWPWMNRGPVVYSGQEMAVAFLLPSSRKRAMTELKAAGFSVRVHSVWSYSKKSLLRLLEESVE